MYCIQKQMALDRVVIRNRIVRVVDSDYAKQTPEYASVRKEIRAALTKKQVVTEYQGRQLDPAYYVGRVIQNAPEEYSIGRQQKLAAGRADEWTHDEMYEMPAYHAQNLKFVGKPIDPMHTDHIHAGVILDQVWDDANRDMWIGFKFYKSTSETDEKGLTGDLVHNLVKAGHYRSLSATTYEDCVPGQPMPLEVGAQQVAVCDEGARSGTEIMDPNKSETPFTFRVTASKKQNPRVTHTTYPNLSVYSIRAAAAQMASQSAPLSSNANQMQQQPSGPSASPVPGPGMMQQQQPVGSVPTNMSNSAPGNGGSSQPHFTIINQLPAPQIQPQQTAPPPPLPPPPPPTSGQIGGQTHPSTIATNNGGGGQGSHVDAAQGQTAPPPLPQPQPGIGHYPYQNPMHAPVPQHWYGYQHSSYPSMWGHPGHPVSSPAQQQQQQQSYPPMPTPQPTQQPHPMHMYGMPPPPPPSYSIPVRAGGNEGRRMEAQSNAGPVPMDIGSTGQGQTNGMTSSNPNYAYDGIQKWFGGTMLDTAYPRMEQGRQDFTLRQEQQTAYANGFVQQQQQPFSGPAQAAGGQNTQSDWYSTAIQAILKDPSIKTFEERQRLINSLGVPKADVPKASPAPPPPPPPSNADDKQRDEKSSERLKKLAEELARKHAEAGGLDEEAHAKLRDAFMQESEKTLMNFRERERQQNSSTKGRGQNQERARNKDGQFMRQGKTERGARDSYGAASDGDDNDDEMGDDDVRGMPRKRTGGGGGGGKRSGKSSGSSSAAAPMDFDVDDEAYQRIMKRVASEINASHTRNGYGGVGTAKNTPPPGPTVHHASKRSNNKRSAHPSQEEHDHKNNRSDEYSDEYADANGDERQAKRMTTHAADARRRHRYDPDADRVLQPEVKEGAMDEDVDPEAVLKEIEEVSRRLVKASLSPIVQLAQTNRKSSEGDEKGYAAPNQEVTCKQEIFTRVVKARSMEMPNPRDTSPSQVHFLEFPNHPVVRELLMHRDRYDLMGMTDAQKANMHRTFPIHADLARNMVSSSYLS
jgi:hypothetical protein